MYLNFLLLLLLLFLLYFLLLLELFILGYIYIFIYMRLYTLCVSRECTVWLLHNYFHYGNKKITPV